MRHECSGPVLTCRNPGCKAFLLALVVWVGLLVGTMGHLLLRAAMAP